MTAVLTTDIRANYSRIATAYAGSLADVLAVHARALAERLPLSGAERVAELGCGPGRLLPYLDRLAPKARVIGVDLTEAMLRQAPRQYARIGADAQALPFTTDSLDAVLMPSNLVTADPVKLAAALASAGFEHIEITSERFHHHPTAAQFLAHSTVIGAMARRLDLLPEDRRTECVEAAERELGRLGPEAFVESGTVLYATARVPVGRRVTAVRP